MKTEYFESAEVSDVGKKRKNNEDACLCIPAHGIFLVADGMGGQAGGDLASESITTTIQDVFAKAGSEADINLARRIMLFRKAANQASKWIKNFADEKVIGQMGSTLVALIIDPGNPARAVALHAGDSRLYRFRKGELKQLTVDHSAIEALAAKLGLKPDQIPAKYQNELTRAVGLTEMVELEKTPVEVLSHDLFLICSDGLTKMLSDETIANFLKRGAQEPVGTLAQTLINEANAAGGKDNVTVVLIKAGDLSGAPKVIDPEEEEEPKTVMVTVAAEEANTPSNTPHDPHPMPDTADAYQGETPQPEKPTPDKTPTPQTPTPIAAPTPTLAPPIPPPIVAPAPKLAAPTAPPVPPLKEPAVMKAPVVIAEEKKEAKKSDPVECKKSPVMAIMVFVAVAVVVSVGIWLATRSRPKTATALVPEAVAATNQPTAVVAANPVSTVPLAKTAVVDKAAEAASNAQAAYREAMKNGQGAYDNQDYTNAVAWAGVALQKIPGDAAATKLRDSAQKLIGEYSQAVSQAQAAYARGDYAGAMSLADQALAVRKNDAAMQKLKVEADAQSKVLAAYREAMKNAQSAFDNHDFKNAAAWTAVALQKIPGDAAATKLQESAQRQLAASGELEQKYQAALQSGQEALKAGNFAVAAAQAKAALLVKPNSPDASQLAKTVQASSDFESARKFFDQGDYDEVVRLCSAYPGVEAFVQLEKDNRTELAALADAKALCSNGDYTFISSLQNQAYAHKPPFVGLLNQAANERKLLGDLETLKQATNWQAVSSKLAEPAGAAVSNKAPFHQLSQWAKTYVAQSGRQKELQQLNLTFEKMLVWFNIKNPTDPYILTPEARKETRRDGDIGGQREQYLKLVDWLESEYKKGGWLEQNDRAKYLKDLRNTIAHRD